MCKEALCNPNGLNAIGGERMSRQRSKTVSAELANQLYNQAFEDGNCSIVVIDPNQSGFPILYVNSAYEALSGYTTGEVLGNSCWILQHGGCEQPDLIGTLANAVSEGRECEAVLESFRKDGSRFWCEIKLSPARVDSSSPAYCVAVLQDVSAKVQIKEQEEVRYALEQAYASLELQMEERTAALQAINAQLSREIGVRKQVEQAQHAHMHYLERIQRVIQAIGRSSDPENWLHNCVSAIRQVFRADRAWLLYPGDPEAEYYSIPVEDTAEKYPGAHAVGERVKMDEASRAVITKALNSNAPVVYNRVEDKALLEKFSIRSQMLMAVYPNIGQPWILGLHQCEHETEWTAEEQRLFSEIGGRIEALLSSVGLHRELKKREERLRALLESTEEGIYGIDADGLCTFANKASIELLGYDDASDLVGKNMRELTQFDCPGAEGGDLSGCHECQIHKEGKGVNWDGGQFVRSDGESFPVEFHCNPLQHSVTMQEGATVTFVNISERKRYEKRIWQQANYDALTGLPSRTLFMDRLSQAVKSALREGGCMALMYVDLDRFKWVNDTLGHDVGDLLLVEAAQRLKSCARRSDTVARIGGDEFIIILPTINGVRGAEQVAEKVMSTLAKPYQLNDRGATTVGGSVGIALYPHDANSAEALLKCADMAMYRAKEEGRNRFAFFTEEMSQAAQEHMRVEQDLHQALKNGEMELYYQPLMDLRLGTIVGAEALLRWNHPDRGLVYPGDFIPLAEETGLIFPIGDWVLQKVVWQLGQWRMRGVPPLTISINISARQCGSDGFIQGLNKALLQSAVPVDKLGLEIEVTEGAMLGKVDEIIDRLQQVSNMGIPLVLDDFGTGHSSLSGLKHFPVQAIKIAREFVQNAADSPTDAGLTRTIISMSQHLGIKVVAEGIETLDQLSFLRDAGCSYGHGHYFSAAMPADVFEAFLKEAC